MQGDPAGYCGGISFFNPCDGGHAGSYPYASGLQTVVFYSRHGQDHEGKHSQKAFYGTAGTEKGSVGRASLESFLLCSHSE